MSATRAGQKRSPFGGAFVRATFAACLVAAFVGLPSPAAAGVTGNLLGTVRATGGAPLAGVRVEVASPSMSRSAVTDAGGRFAILALAPDTYTVALNKPGYEDVAFRGVTVFADQTQTLEYAMRKTLRTIARVTSSGSASLVKPGVGIDVYSVSAPEAAAAAPLGGGGNLNNAYSAMAIVPGVQVAQRGIGWAQNAAYIRGQNHYYSGFEYDGVPVNRAFDNYNASTEPTLGLQELQVYPGGGPPSVATVSTAGFINEVIKTGTFPGFATANLGIGAPAFYHQAQVEVGGSTPDRTFSYYVGFMGFNQTYRYIDNSNGAGYAVPGGIFSGNTAGDVIGFGFGSNQLFNVGYACLFGTCQGVKPICPLYGAKFKYPDQGCWQYYSSNQANTLAVTDRENVVNLHLGIPKANGLRDDVQLLWSSSALNNYGYSSLNDMGPGVDQLVYSLYNTRYAPPICGTQPLATWGAYTASTVVLSGFGCTSPPGNAQQIYSFLQPRQFFLQQFYGYPSGPYHCATFPLACAPTYLGYVDSVAYNLPFGTPIARSPTSFRAPSAYFAPDTPSHAFDGPLPIYDSSIDVEQNDTGITKAQYTHALSSAAYVRAYAYTFYSDWMETDPTLAAGGYLLGSFASAAQYQLFTHTAGGALDFEDQIDAKNFLSVSANLTTANVLRVSNQTANGGPGVSPIGYMAKNAGGYVCYDPSTGSPVPCLSSQYYDTTLTTPSGKSCGEVYNVSCEQRPTWIGHAATGPPGWPNSFAPAGSPAAKAGATWDTLWTSNLSGSYNDIRPLFVNAAVQDQFRPSDQFVINAALRYDDFTYGLPDSLTAATQFYANMTANFTCILAATDIVLTLPLAPGVPPPASTQYVKGDCNQAASVLRTGGPHTGWVHPNGTMQDGVQAPNFTASSPSAYALNYWEPRFSATYTLNPDTVIRAAAGRFAQPPIAQSVQYLSLSGDARSAWNDSMGLGFFSPFHPIPAVTSDQYDLSWEQRLKGTDVSFKVTPFYSWVNDWQQFDFVGPALVSQIPVGVNRDRGVEFSFLKGDVTQNGLSAIFSFTYTNSQVMFQNIPLLTGDIIPNQLAQLNEAISQYNELTRAGGGSPCYQATKAVACSTRNGKIATGFDTILNPYFNRQPQPLLDESAWYQSFAVGLSPNLSGQIGGYISPYVSSLILNWKRNKLAIVPSFNFQSGGSYGSPLDTEGLDPRSCMRNSATTGITKLSPSTSPRQCNYLYELAPGETTFAYLYVPNPQTGAFLFDNYRQPDSVVANLQVSYDVNPRIKIGALATSLWHACFGGTPAPWTAAYPAGFAVCGYGPAGGSLNNALYPSNFYNGTGIFDYRANHARTPFTQSYTPNIFNSGAIGAGLEPINVYFNAQVRL